MNRASGHSIWHIGDTRVFAAPLLSRQDSGLRQGWGWGEDIQTQTLLLGFQEKKEKLTKSPVIPLSIFAALLGRVTALF